MTVTLNNTAVISVLGVHGQTLQFEGVARDSLIFLMDPEQVTLSQAMEAFSHENCSQISITGDDGSVAIHEHYDIRVEAGQGYRDYAINRSVGGPLVEGERTQVVYVRMAQSTLSERTIHQQQEILDTLLLTQLEVPTNV